MFFFLGSGWQGNVNTQVVEKFAGVERSIFGNVLNIIRIAGSGIALIMLTWMSISYFTANGRGMPFAAERQADIKGKQLSNFAIGVAVFVGASNILYYVATFIYEAVFN